MNYRIYILNEQLQILEARDFESREDLAALDEANKFTPSCPVEVWQERRLVARLARGGEARYAAAGAAIPAEARRSA